MNVSKFYIDDSINKKMNLFSISTLYRMDRV